MFSHVVVGADEPAIAKKFYDAIFEVIGCDEQGSDAMGRLFYTKNNQRFIVMKPINGAPTTYANGGTIGFLLSSAEAVHLWHKKGTESGGTSAETPPHTRETDGKCVAYLRDPSGNKLCAFYQT